MSVLVYIGSYFSAWCITQTSGNHISWWADSYRQYKRRNIFPGKLNRLRRFQSMNKENCLEEFSLFVFLNNQIFLYILYAYWYIFHPQLSNSKKTYYFNADSISDTEKWIKSKNSTVEFICLQKMHDMNIKQDPILTFLGFLYSILKQFLCPRDQRSGGILILSCLSFFHSLWNFNLANNFWTVSARALIFHLSIPCDETFLWVPLFFTLWPWPDSLTYFFKTLILLITFE